MELPGAVLSVIFGMISDPRARNCLSLTCKGWYYLERQTRSSLVLRGNICSFLKLPVSFRFVKRLDLSHCSPWGYSVFQFTSGGGELIGQMLREAFPNVRDLAVYVRDAVDIQMVAWVWPELESLRLVRFHQRSPELGSEVEPILRCEKLRKVDLSQFYCWTEDILPALESRAATAANLLSLNLLKLSPEGFQSQEIIDITGACGNLEELFVLCNFDPRYPDSVCDRALESIGAHCPKLRVLHLVDNKEWGVHGSDVADGPAEQDADVSFQGLDSMFRNLPQLQDLALLLGQNVWDSRLALEALFASCAHLTSLQLSHFHGLCQEGQAGNGLAKGAGLLELSIKNSVDLCDSGLLVIAQGCRKLQKLTLKGCREISEEGVSCCVGSLSRTLVDVGIFSCARLHAVETLRALEPIRSSVRKLHVDCVWDDAVVARQALASSLADGAGAVEHGRPEMVRPMLGSSSRESDSAAKCTRIGGPNGSDSGMGWGRASSSQGMQMNPREGVRSGAGSRDFDGAAAQNLDLLGNQGEGNGGHGAPRGSDSEACWGRACISQGMRQQLNSKEGMRLRAGNGDLDGAAVAGHEGLEGEGFARSEHCGGSAAKRVRISGTDSWLSTAEEDGVRGGGHHGEEEEEQQQEQAPDQRCWGRLQALSLWVGVGLLISPLPSMGLGQCPELQEVSIKVEGDCKSLRKPVVRDFGLATLARYEQFSKLNMDLGEVASFSLSAPEGHLDLSVWERHYMGGIAQLQLVELNYVPPCDKDLDHRGLSLPAVGYLSQCFCIRKLIVHGSMHEHFLSMLRRNRCLRDFQLRWDFYPAPEYETRNEVRVEAYRRFEEALAERGWPD